MAIDKQKEHVLLIGHYEKHNNPEEQVIRAEN